MSFSLQPFREAEPAIQIHIVFGLVAAITGIVVFARRKGGRVHKQIGYVWFLAMGMVALSSLFIHQIRVWGAFSPLHLLSLATFASLAFAFVMIRCGNVRAHEMALKGLFLGGVVFAGLLTFSRGLVMHRIVFGETGGQFMPAPGELPGGPVVFGLIGALAIFVTMVLSTPNSRRSKSTLKEGSR